MLFSDLFSGVEPPPVKEAPPPKEMTPPKEDDDCTVKDFFDYIGGLEIRRVDEPKADPVPVEGAARELYYPPGLSAQMLDGISLVLARQLLRNGPYSLTGLQSFEGAGVYAIYYVGDRPSYEGVCSPGATLPIYVGKSGIPGRSSGNLQAQTQGVHSRLVDGHLESINQAYNLAPEDFLCRFLLFHNMLVELAEYALIQLYQPVWNTGVRGFGSRQYSSDTRGRDSAASSWDTLHPGRDGAALGAPLRPLEVIEADLEARHVPLSVRRHRVVMRDLGMYED